MPETGGQTIDLDWFEKVTIMAHAEGLQPQPSLFQFRDRV